METPRRRRMTWSSSSEASLRRMEYPALRPLQKTAQTYSSRSRRRALRVSLSRASLTTPEAISLCSAVVSMGSSMRKTGGARVSSWMARLTRPRRGPKSVTVVAWSARRFARTLCLPRSATILQPDESIGTSLNILKIPPPWPPPPLPPPPPPPPALSAILDRRPLVDGRSSDRRLGPSMKDGIGV
uniref:Uncharacterized protein n=1 Tax=Avena sativa TaxID=4498 RepID=A0ACD5XSR9_AVESA